MYIVWFTPNPYPALLSTDCVLAGSEEKACRLSSNSCTLMVSTCTTKVWHDPYRMYDMMPYPAIPLQFDGKYCKYWWMPTHFYIEMVGPLVYWCLLLGLCFTTFWTIWSTCLCDSKKSAPALYLYLEAWGCYDVRIPKPSATFFHILSISISSWLPSGKLTVRSGKPPLFMGKSSMNGWFSIAMWVCSAG